MKEKDNFKNDIIIGEEKELEILDIIRCFDENAYKIEGEFKPYDIIAPNLNKTFEVKYDKGSKKTSNFFIEYECNGKPSGLSSTEADYWVHCDEKENNFIRTADLKCIVKDKGFKYDGTPEGGVSNVKAYLVKKKYIRENKVY